MTSINAVAVSDFDDVNPRAPSAAIFTESEKLEVIKKEAGKAVEIVRREYVQQIGKDIAQSVRDSYKAGKLRLLAPAEEGIVAVKAEIKERIALIDEAVKKLRTGDGGRCRYDGGKESHAWYPEQRGRRL